MTANEISQVAGYLANPTRNTHIELEIPQNSLPGYMATYQVTSGGLALGMPNEAVYVIPPGGNKWGREMRIYFTCINPIVLPPVFANLITVGGRAGYDIYDYRVNNIALIDELIRLGFVIGSPQNEPRIRGLITPQLIADFNNGYAIP